MNAKRLRMGSAAVAVGGVLAGSWMAGGSHADAAQVPTPAPAAGRTHTVTLVTGDRVTTGSRGRVSVEAGPGRAGITFGVSTYGDRVTVTPSDTIGRLAAGTLDRRLFDVTALIEAGYDRGDPLPLIVAGSTKQGVTGLERTRDLPAVRGVAVRQRRDRAADTWRTLSAGGGKIWLDGKRRPALDASVAQVGAPAAWDRGFTGTGTTVAVLDSGIDDQHPDLAGQVVGRQNFTDGSEADADLSGHGTHVAATVAGTGASDPEYRGVAPGAKLLDGKVCDVDGCAESWIVAGMTWATVDRHAKVVNLSLSGDDDPDVVDPVEQAVETLSEQTGALFVVAAGNAREPVPGVGSPGSAPAALTVGAVDAAGKLASFSRRGPTGDGRLKPDITAPGVDITAARGSAATRVPGRPGDLYTTLSGTSMAAPHVAGGAAILSQQHPTWSGRQLKSALMQSARPDPAVRGSGQGAGLLDLARAVDQQVTSSPASLSFGVQRWPHADDQVLTRPVTYQNPGPVPLTLALRLDTGTPFAVSPASVVVPAGGTATVTVTVDTRGAGPDGYLADRLVATTGGVESAIPLVVEKEVESYELTLVHTGRDGVPTDQSLLNLAERDGGFHLQTGGADSTSTVRVPSGHYTLSTIISTGSDPDRPTLSLLADPDLVVDRAMTVELDARLARPVSLGVSRRDARPVDAAVGVHSENSGSTILGSSFAQLFAGRIGSDQPVNGFTSVVYGQFARPGKTASPYFYSLFYPIAGHMVSGYRRTVADAELAAVRADFAATGPGTTGARSVMTGSATLGSGFFGPQLEFRLPFTRTEFYNTDPGIVSNRDLAERFPTGEETRVEDGVYRAYRTGRTYHEQWNRGVFGTSGAIVDDNADPRLDIFPGAYRSGDAISPDVAMYADGAGRLGNATDESGDRTLWRDGTVVIPDENGRFAVPAAEAGYRLRVTAERAPALKLSTRVETDWTFRSGHVDPATAVHLPLWTIRFAPALDALNTARTVDVPVILTPQPGSGTGPVVDRTVDASFDDGATWRRVRLNGANAEVRPPSGSGFVSLRASARDSKGNTVRTTVIRAYRYGPVR